MSGSPWACADYLRRRTPSTRHPPHFAARHAAEDKPRIWRWLPASEGSKKIKHRYQKLHQHRPQNNDFLVSFQVCRQDWESRGTSWRDTAAAAAKAAIMEGDKSGRQGGCRDKIFVDQDPLHREVRTPIADATWGKHISYRNIRWWWVRYN